MDKLSDVSAAPRRTAAALSWLLPLALVVVVLGGMGGWRLWAAAHRPSGAAMPLSAMIEDRWGVRVSMVGATADNGLVDMRYIVIDPSKAQALLHDEKNLPVMIAEDSGTLINSTTLMSHKQELTPGTTYFMLYRNTNGAIKPGTALTVKFGDLALEHVIAR